MSRWNLLAVAFVVAAFTSGKSALAGEPENLIAEGIKLRKQNRDQEALPLFRKALDLKATPRALGQLGTCEQALGLWVAAESHIMEALNYAEDPWVRLSGEALSSALHFVQERLGSIAVWGTPAGAIVRIDGERVATLPMSSPVRAPIGQRGLTVEFPKHFSESRAIDVRPGALVREHVALRALQVAAVAPDPNLFPAAASSEAPPGVTPSPLGAISAEQRTWKTPVGAGLAVVGLALLTWGVVWIAIDGAVVGEASAMGTPVRDTKAAGWILAGVGAASAIGGGILLYADRNQQSRIAVGLTPAGVRLGGAF